MNASEHTLKTIAVLQAHYGQRFLFKELHLPIWENALGSIDPGLVERAVAVVVQQHTHGAPGLAEIKQALAGRWESRKVARTNANCVPDPQALGYEIVTCLIDYGTGEVQRAFNERGDLIEWGSQRVIQSKLNVPPALAPPRMNPDAIEAEQRPAIQAPEDDDSLGNVLRPDFKEWGA